MALWTEDIVVQEMTRPDWRYRTEGAPATAGTAHLFEKSGCIHEKSVGGYRHRIRGLLHVCCQNSCILALCNRCLNDLSRFRRCLCRKVSELPLYKMDHTITLSVKKFFFLKNSKDEKSPFRRLQSLSQTLPVVNLCQILKFTILSRNKSFPKCTTVVLHYYCNSSQLLYLL